MGLIQDSMTIYKREMLLFQSNLRTNLIRSMIFPLIILIFFGSLGSSITGIPVAVANYANNPSSVQFINSLEANKVVSVTSLTNQETGLGMLHSGTVEAVLVILPSFPRSSNGSPSVYLYYSGSEFSQAGAVLSAIASSAAAFGANVGSSAEQAGLVKTVSTQGTGSNYRDFLVASVILMAVAFGAVFGGGMSIIIDRQLGNIKAFLITPINKKAILIGKLLSGTLQSIIYGILAIIIGLVLGAKIAMGLLGIPYILAMLALTGMAFSGITLLLGSRIKRIEVYTIGAQSFVMPAWFLPGAFFPTSSFPPILQPFSTYDPLTYATNGIRSVMLNGFFPISSMITDFGVMIIFTAVAVIASFILFKNTIE